MSWGFSPGSVSILPVELNIMRNRAVPTGLRDSWIRLPRIHVRCSGLHPGLFSHSPCREKVVVARYPNRGKDYARMWQPKVFPFLRILALPHSEHDDRLIVGFVVELRVAC